ncbi:Spy/CpxP family protein refolding chaperone [Methylobacillus flagellatus]|uniref:Spy/CpxP family protein refolding chaperone n=1 Tax=Methylobacillus flagellatus TaxID=405 RepID=UPI002853AC31|nr:Spy/CpxP family protein refolding chaperone [Methylobacillus flagellatus]MDR5171713.1 Spy/CpxP family protein refolding chaperone [Methylobacillus flagellatus]
MNPRIIPSMILMAAFAISSTWASAEPPLREDSPPRPGSGFIQEAPGFALPPHLAGLELSEAQEDKIFYLLHAEAPAIRNNFKQQRKLREEIDKLGTAPSFDEKKARQLAAELARVQSDAIFSRVSTESRIRALLTPEQLGKLDERKELGKGRPDLRPFPASKPWEGRPKEDRPRPI